MPEKPTITEPCPRCAELEQDLDRRYNELVTLSRLLDESEAERYSFRSRFGALRDNSQPFLRNYDALCASLGGRVGFAIMRLLLSPLTLGRGHTILDDMGEQRKKLPR